MSTFDKVFKVLADNNIESARFEAREISNFFTADKEALAAAERRIKGEPLQYILGEWEFFGLKFSVGEGVLIPRADTEILVEEAIKIIGNKEMNVLDLCSGSGAVAIAVEKHTNARVTAIEKSEKAFSYLQRNIELNNVGVKAVKGDIFGEFDFPEKFDLILSNPPYIETEVIETLQKEVLYEPKMALDGGKDGLIFYKRILEYWSKMLKPNGIVAVEIGYDQMTRVTNLFVDNGFDEIKQLKDYSGNQRVIIGTLRP